jgi:ribosomal protein S18 acetylase RimI-like enzyme
MRGTGSRDWTSSTAGTPVRDRFSATVDVLVRPCVEADLEALEWHGCFASHRGLIAGAYRRQAGGEVLMLVAEVARFPAGQLWIDFARGGPDRARLWAFRVIPCLRGAGIGTRLLRAAERAMAARAVQRAEVGCEKVNARARRFYEARGYGLAYEEVDHYTYETPAGERIEATSDMWILQKRLAG